MTCLQLIHNGQNVGRQKQQFLESAEPPIPHERPVTAELCTKYHATMASCPFKCGEKEDNIHYMLCTSATATNKRTQLLNKFRATLTRYDVHPAITPSLLIHGLVWVPGSKEPTCIKIGETSINVEIDNQSRNNLR